MGLDLAGIGVHSTYSLRLPKPGPAGPSFGLPELHILPGAREEPDERLCKCLGVLERGGVPGAGNLLDSCVRDVVNHVLCADIAQPDPRPDPARCYWLSRCGAPRNPPVSSPNRSDNPAAICLGVSTRTRAAAGAEATREPERTPTASTTAGATRPGSLTVCRTTQRTPSVKRAATSPLTTIASRVFPQPPEPVNVTTRVSASRSATLARSRPRPMNAATPNGSSALRRNRLDPGPTTRAD